MSRFDPMKADEVLAALKQVPREKWATVLGMIFVQQIPADVLEEIALKGRRAFIKAGLKSDIIGLKAEDYSDIYHYIVLSVQAYNQARVAVNPGKNQSMIALSKTAPPRKLIVES